MQKILEPILPEKSVLRLDKTRNLMVLAGTGSELQNILETINVFDVNLLKDMSVMIYPLQNVNAETIISELEQVFGNGPDEDNPLRGMFKVIPIERMNSVMVITPQPQYLQEARTWLERLDRSTVDTGGSGGIYVYRVQNLRATTLADLLNALFSTGGKKASPPGQVSPGRSAVSIGAIASSVAGATSSGTNLLKSSASQLSVGGHQGVRVIPDEDNNSLVIVATAQAYKTLMDVITKLDISPLQVLIDATIIEVNLTDSLKHGIQWYFKHGFAGIGMAETKLSSNTDGSLAANYDGFSYSVTDNASGVRAVLTALAEQNNVKVISSPSLMVLNNQEAMINVGDKVPIAVSSSTNTSGGGGEGTSPIVTNLIDMVDTGVTLNITPRVNAGGMVIMTIEQEANEAITTTSSTLNSPTIQQRKIKSSIAVQSGDTIVLGGLIKDKRTGINSGIPLLKDIPYLGWLFSNQEKSVIRTELVVLITPRIVQNRNDAVLITTGFKRKLTGIFEELKDEKQ
jgi:general secretion pathway protein D